MSLLTLAPGETSISRIVTIVRQIAQYLNGLGLRKAQSTPITFYVSTAGSDTNDGLTAGTPWRHIQHAVDYVCTSVDIDNVLVKIKLADGTYSEGVILRDYVGAVVSTQINPRASATEPRIEGNLATPANVVVDGGSNPAFFAASALMPWFVDGLTVKNGIFTDYASLVNIGTVTFGTNTYGPHIMARYGSRVEIIRGSTITVTAGANAFASAQFNGIILAQGSPGDVTGVMSGTPAFTDAFAKVNDQSSTLDLNSISWTGSATGARAYINGGSNGAADPTTYPGSTAPIYDFMFLNVTRGQFPGTASNDNPSAGNIGEYVESVVASGSAVSLVNVTGKTITSISLTAGDWDISGFAYFNGGATTNVTVIGAEISTTANQVNGTLGKSADLYGAGGTLFNNGFLFVSVPIPVIRFSLNATTTMYLSGYCQFSTSTAAAFGILRARRVR